MRLPAQTHTSLREINLVEDSVVSFLELSRVKEPDGRYYIGRESTGVYLHLDSKYAEFIRLCDGDRSLRDVVDLYAHYNNYPEDKIPELLQEALFLIFKLVDYKFVYSIDGILLEKELPSATRALSHRRPSKLLRFIFNPLVLTFVFAFFSMAVVIYYFGAAIFIQRTKHFPLPQDMFWHPNFTISLITGFLVSWVFLYKHELAHLFAARSFGADGEIRLSRRLFFLVAETRLHNIYKLTRHKRFVIYLAGMASDAAVVAISLFFLILHERNILSYPLLAYAFLKQLILISWQSLLWQFKFFLATDIYALVEDASGCDKLLFLTKQRLLVFSYKYLAKISAYYQPKLEACQRILTSQLYLRARPMLRWYIWFFFFGLLFTLVQFSFYQVPISFLSIQRGIQDVLLGSQTGSATIIFGGFILLGLQTVHWGLLSFVYIRDTFSSQKKSVMTG